MDRKALFKPKENKSKYTLSAVKREKTKSRTEKRNDLHSTRRPNLLETEHEEAEKSSNTPIDNSTVTNKTKLTRQQAFYNKFCDWQKHKIEAKMNNTSSKRPFTSAVPIGRFTDKVEGTVNNRKPVHQFPQPINFKIPSTINQPIIKKDLKMPTKQKAQSNVKVDLPTPIHKVAKQTFFGPCITSTLKKETNKDVENKKIVSKAKIVKPVKRLVQTRSATVAKLPIFKKPTATVVSNSNKNRKKTELLPIPTTETEIFSPIYPMSSDEMPSEAEERVPQPPPPPADSSIATAAATAVVDDHNITPTKTNSPNRSLNYVSPFVTTLRGKNSAKKEKKHRDSVYKLELNQSIEEPIEVRRNREAAAYFRKQLEQESERLLSMVAEWDAYKTKHCDTMESEYVDMIDVTIGQTRLLTTKKFMQFSGLIDQCDSGTGLQKVFARDLEGFWSLVGIQVENCDNRFDKLNKLKANKWKDVEAKKMKKVKKTNNVVTKEKNNVADHDRVFMQMINRAKAEYKRQKDVNITAKSPASSQRKTLLAAVLNNEASKLKMSPIPRRSSVNCQSTKKQRKSSSSKENSPLKATKSILKTPGTKRKAKSVVFRQSLENNGHRRSLSTPNGVKKLHAADSDVDFDAESNVIRRKSLQQLNKNLNDSVLNTSRSVRDINFDESLSLAGSPRRSSRLRARNF